MSIPFGKNSLLLGFPRKTDFPLLWLRKRRQRVYLHPRNGGLDVHRGRPDFGPRGGRGHASGRVAGRRRERKRDVVGSLRVGAQAVSLFVAASAARSSSAGVFAPTGYRREGGPDIPARLCAGSMGCAGQIFTKEGVFAGPVGKRGFTF